MPWVRFKERFDFCIKPGLVIQYRAGHRYLVKQSCAEQAIKAGKAEPAERKGKRTDDERR